MTKNEAHQAAVLSLKKLMRLILETICRKTENPIIEFNSDSCEFLIQVDGRDHGRIVGKGGRVIGALEAIFWYAGLVAIRNTVGIELIDPERQEGDIRSTPFVPKSNWDKEKVSEMLGAILLACLGEKNQTWEIQDAGDHALATVKINKFLQKGLSMDPEFETALAIVVRAAGMSSGSNLQTEVIWE